MSESEHRDGRSADRCRVRLLEGTLTQEHGSPSSDEGGPRYRLRASVDWFVDSHGTLCFLRPGADDLLVRDPDPADIALVRLLEDRSEPAPWLAARLNTGGLELDLEAVQRKLDSLVEADLVLARVDALAGELDPDDAERFSRQLPYLAEFGDEVALQRRLRDSSVAVIGCGGIGTWAISALACAGIGRVVLVDDDLVELSNLNRQMLYGLRDLGTPKVFAAARWVSGFDPVIDVSAVRQRITSADDVSQVVAGMDAVVLAADTPPYQIARWANTACIAARVPFIVAGQVPPLVKVGPLYVVPGGPCFSCHESALRRESRAYDEYVASRQISHSAASTLGAASCLIGGLLGLELLHLLTGQRAATCDAALLVDIRTLEMRREPVEREPNCEACNHLDQ